MLTGFVLPGGSPTEQLEQAVLAEKCPKCTFTFPVLGETPSSFAVFKDLSPEPDFGLVTSDDGLQPVAS